MSAGTGGRVKTLVRGEAEAFFGALRFFTRVPVPAWVGHSADGLNASARYFPAVGILVGLVGAITFALAAAVWPTPVAVVAAMAATVYLTGAFHEDGLADTADGIGGGWTREDILRIMKDSRTGSYGVVAVVLLLLGKFAALSALPLIWLPLALVAAHAASRGASVSLLAFMDYAREDASSKAKPLATRLARGGLATAAAFAVLPSTLLLAMTGAAPILAAWALMALSTLWLVRLYRRNLGGYTGDMLGAVQQVTELAFYLGLLCSFT